MRGLEKGRVVQDIEGRIEEIRDDRAHGATFLAKVALRTLALAVASQPPGGSPGGSTEELRAIGARLTHAKPAMAAIKNMVARFLEELERMREGFDPLATERNLLDEMETASQKAARAASPLIPDGGRVLTCSHSSAVTRALRLAKPMGRNFTVSALESWSGQMSYGRALAEEVRMLGIAAILVPDDDVYSAVAGVDLVLVGANKLLPDGSVVNGSPTVHLARAAKGVASFYVV